MTRLVRCPMSLAMNRLRTLCAIGLRARELLAIASLAQRQLVRDPK
jgi:hypothetical protein